MILVDTSVWIDHLHRSEPRLVGLLHDDRVAVHDDVIEELALGSLRRRDDVIGLLETLTRVPVLRHDEMMSFIENERFWGRGLSAVDVQLLGSARIAGARLWTRDKRLRAAATDLGVAAPEADG